MRASALTLGLVLGMLLPGLAQAQLNPFYPVQGVLQDSAGVPVNGPLSVIFALYVEETSSTGIWNETTTVDFDEGLFSVYLGEVNTLDPGLFATNDGLWLGITVGSDPEMDRVFLASTPYSAYAEHAANADSVAANSVTGTLTSGQLPAGTVIGPQGCPGGSYAIGLDVAGALTCLAAPTGADFALSDQLCPVGQVMVGIDTAGVVECEGAAVAFDSGSGTIDLGTDVEITGDLTITGSLNAGGVTFGLPTNPMMLLGRTEEFCTASSGNNVGWVTYPASFPATPVFVGGMDESLNDSGASWIRTHQSHRNRAGVRCSSNLDSLHWLAIEPGQHTVDNRMIQAGTTGSVSSGSAIFFPQVFAQPPVVLVQVAQTNNQSGATRLRIINTVTTGGFEIWTDGQIDALSWIAMEPGEYTYGNWHWYAGVYATGNSCSSSCTWSLPSNMFTDAVNAVMSINDTNNSGASYIRHRALAADEVTVRMNNSAENIHYVVWENL